MAVVLPDNFQVILPGGLLIAPRRIIGEGHPSTGTPNSELDACLRNAHHLWGRANLRRLASWGGAVNGHSGASWLCGELVEDTDTATASAVPLASVHALNRGELRLEFAAKLSLGRESANTQIFLEADHEEGTLNVVLCDRAGSVGAHWVVTRTTRGVSSTSLTGVGVTLGTRELLVRVYMARTVASANNHKLYGLRVYERHIPVGDL